MLLLQGKSNRGKTSFIKVFFPSNVFGNVDIDPIKSFGDGDLYSDNCLLWVWGDINIIKKRSLITL